MSPALFNEFLNISLRHTCADLYVLIKQRNIPTLLAENLKFQRNVRLYGGLRRAKLSLTG